LYFKDNARIVLGDSSDFRMYHTPNSGAYGGANILGANGHPINLMTSMNGAGENGIIINPNADVILYHDNVVKLQTTSTGVKLPISSGGDGMEFFNSGDIYPEIVGNMNRTLGDKFLISLAGKWNNNHVVGKIAIETGDDTTNKDDGRITFFTAESGGNIAERLEIQPNGNIDIPADNRRLRIGAGQDLQIYHDGTYSRINATSSPIIVRTGMFHINNGANNKALFKATDGGAVELYYNDVKRLETTSTGASVTGNLAVSGVLTYDDVTNVDSVGVVTARQGVRVTADGSTSSNYISVGASDDLKIYHSGSHSFIDNTTGQLYLRGGSQVISLQATNVSHSVRCAPNAEVKLYHAGSEKLATTAYGIDVTGTTGTDGLAVSGISTFSSDLLIPTSMDSTDAGGVAIQRFWSFNLANGNVYKCGHWHEGEGAVQLLISVRSITGAHSGTSTYIFQGGFRALEGTGNYDGDFHKRLMPLASGSGHGNGADRGLSSSGGWEVLINQQTSYTYGVVLHVPSGRNNKSLQVTVTELNRGNTFTDQSSSAAYSSITTNASPLLPSSYNYLGNTHLRDNYKINLGNSDDLQIYHTPNSSFIDNNTNHLYIRSNVDGDDNGNIYLQALSGENSIICNDDGSVELYHDNTKKAYTQNNGFYVTDTGQAAMARVLAPTGYAARFDMTSDLGANHEDNYRIEVGTDQIFKIQGKPSGNYTTFVQINQSGHVLPGTDSAYNIGSNGVRFANGYFDTLYGDGSNLTGITQTTINSNVNNYVVTATGTANTLQGESALTFSSGRLHSGAITLNDNGISGALLNIRADDQGPWSFIIGNDTYHASSGLYGYQPNNGDFLLRLVGNSEYKSFTFEQHNGSSNRSWAQFGNGGNVKLFYQGSERLATTSSGVDVTGRLTADDLTIENTTGNLSGYFTATNGLGTLEIGGSTGAFIDLKHPATDDYDMRLGVSGSNGYINTANNFNLYVKANENAIYAAADAGVFLYFNGASKLQTTSQGIQVENTAGISVISSKGTGSNRADLQVLQTGTADANIWLDASNGDLSGADYANIRHDNSTLDLTFTNYANDIVMYVRGGSIGAGGLRKAFHAHENGAVELYNNGNKKFETTAIGVEITGTLVTGAADAIVIDDSNNLKFCVGTYSGNPTSTGTVSMDARTYDTNKARLHKWTSPSSGGGSYGQYSEAWYDGGAYRYIYSTSSGFSFEHHVIPFSNNTYDLGTSSYRWRNVYTNDLNLSNEGSSNDVDGTWGSYTIQEGEDDLFLINKRNGKKYKFNLTEVS